jgi:hypothetical protein
MMRPNEHSRRELQAQLEAPPSALEKPTDVNDQTLGGMAAAAVTQLTGGVMNEMNITEEDLGYTTRDLAGFATFKLNKDGLLNPDKEGTDRERINKLLPVLRTILQDVRKARREVNFLLFVAQNEAGGANPTGAVVELVIDASKSGAGGVTQKMSSTGNDVRSVDPKTMSTLWDKIKSTLVEFPLLNGKNVESNREIIKEIIKEILKSSPPLARQA